MIKYGKSEMGNFTHVRGGGFYYFSIPTPAAMPVLPKPSAKLAWTKLNNSSWEKKRGR